MGRTMRKPEKGVSCPGCPHRAAFVAVKEAVGRGRGRVYCGDAGCSIVGPLHPAATTCPGGEAALRDRYRQPVPDGAPEARARVCAHFVRAEVLGERADELDHLAQEGETVLLCVLASSRAWLDDASVEKLVGRARALGAAHVAVLDPFDTLASQDALECALGAGGVSALIFRSPCVQLQHGEAAPAEVDRFACVGCHRCYQITGCPALSFTPPVYTIDPDACAGCDLCCDFCRTHVIYSDRQRLSPADRHAARMAAAGL